MRTPVSKIKLRAALPIALIFAMLAAVEFLYFPGRTKDADVRALTAKAVAVSELAAHSVAPAVEFEDQEAAQEVFKGAARDDELEYVVAYTATGVPFAKVSRTAADSVPARAPP